MRFKLPQPPAFATTDQRPVTHRFEHHRHRGPAADRLGDDLGFLRRLCLTGDWPAAEAFIAPTVNHPRVNHRRMLGALRRQAFLETVDAADTSAMSFRDDGDVSLEGGDVADRLVKALSALEPYVEDPKQFNDLCFLCTLGAVTEHPEYAEWTPSRGRLAAFDTCVDELREVYGSIPDGRDHERVMETAMRHAVAHAAQVSSLSGRRPPRSAGLLERLAIVGGSTPRGGGDGVHRFFAERRRRRESNENATPNVTSEAKGLTPSAKDPVARELGGRELGGTLPTFVSRVAAACPPRASIAVTSFPAIDRLERIKRPGLLGRSWNPGAGAGGGAGLSNSLGAGSSNGPAPEEEREAAIGAEKAVDARDRPDEESPDPAWDVTPEEAAREAEFVADGEAFVAEAEAEAFGGADPDDEDAGDEDEGDDGDFFKVEDGIGAYAAVDPTRPPVFYQPNREPACADADAGIRCLAWNPGGDVVCGVNCVADVDGSNPRGGESATAGGVFACATSGRTLHVCTGAGKTLLRVRDVHGAAADCSIYALAWGDDAKFGGTHSLIATGGNDGSVGVTRLRWSDDFADSLRLVAVGDGAAKVNPRAHRGGAVRGVAFLNPTSVVSGGGGDYSPRVWNLGEAGEVMPDECERELRAHGSEIVGVCADWGSFAGAGSTENFAATASADGEVRVWDLREASGAPPTLRLNARGAAGGARDARLSALSVRGERVAVGYTDGGVAVLDLRFASTADVGQSSGNVRDDSAAAVVWSDRFHEGECRSVDLDPSGKLLLTAGFDGVCVVVNAADGVNANVSEYGDESKVVDGGRGCYCGHVDKVVNARWRPGTRDGAVGFASCGVDRTVRYWHAAARRRVF